MSSIYELCTDVVLEPEFYSGENGRKTGPQNNTKCIQSNDSVDGYFVRCLTNVHDESVAVHCQIYIES